MFNKDQSKPASGFLIANFKRCSRKLSIQTVQSIQTIIGGVLCITKNLAKQQKKKLVAD
ncbi:hypothetical protein [Sulfurimonas sp. HSL3-7]|uniref:hypothetical protein n=1 Tax=Sulfonitrofixus jiaomeiensis TaxID=3131938 RepID=UPI0031F7D95A